VPRACKLGLEGTPDTRGSSDDGHWSCGGFASSTVSATGLRAVGPRTAIGSLGFSSNRFLIGELLLGKLSETVVVHGNAAHDRPRSLVSHLIGNRASFLYTKALGRSLMRARFNPAYVVSGLRRIFAHCGLTATGT